MIVFILPLSACFCVSLFRFYLSIAYIFCVLLSFSHCENSNKIFLYFWLSLFVTQSLLQGFLLFCSKQHFRFSPLYIFQIQLTAFPAVNRVQYKTGIGIIQKCQCKTQVSTHSFKRIVLHNSDFLECSTAVFVGCTD